MTTLPDRQIRALGRSLGLLTPFREEHVQPASIDLCLGDEFIVYEPHGQMYVDLDNPIDESAKKVKAPPDRGFMLQPKQFILGVTEEVVNLPNDIVARLEGKSSIGRLGIMIHVTAGFIDPGFHGPITLEICNLRDIPVVLRPGLPFCQLSFQFLSSPCAKPYNGRYQDATGVEPSKLYTDQGGPDYVPVAEQREGFGGIV
jgi:dCTP deaminase